MTGRIAAVLIAAAVAVAVAVTAPGAAAGDERAPEVRFTTTPGAVVPGGPVPGAGVRGIATDDASGVARVRVTYCSGGTDPSGGWSCGSGFSLLTTVQSYDATLTCATPRRCSWVAEAPLRPGRYLAFARATDRAGRTESAREPIDVVVV